MDRPSPIAAAAALARLYDLDLAGDPGDPGDLDLYLALASRTGGPILELAAGSGRLAIPLAAAGFDVTGVDNDPAMLARARAAAGQAADHLTWVEADLLGLRLPGAGAFQLAFLALNSLLVLAARDAQREALQTLAAHLSPGGLAVVDVWQPDADDLARFDGRLILEWTRIDPDTGRMVAKTGSALHDAAAQRVTLTTFFDEWEPGRAPTRWHREDRLRLVSADELTGFALDAGLEIERIAGSYDLEPIDPGSERAILVAQRS